MPADICIRCKGPVSLARDYETGHYYVHTETGSETCPSDEGVA